MASLDPVDSIEVDTDSVHLVMVASSFEPRSIRAAELIEGNIERVVIFNYDDTLITAVGQEHARKIEAILREKSSSVEILGCQVAEPFGVVRAFHTYITKERLVGSVQSVVLDATCFTKLHLLLLLRFLRQWLRIETLQVCYTKPLIYGTAHGKELSFGIRKTVYLPYRQVEQQVQASRTGLIALLGHEPYRLERLIQEIEPDLCVVLLGEPGYTDDMAKYSRTVNERLIRRAEYDRHYRHDTVPVDDIVRCREILAQQLTDLYQEDCGHVYIAPLGTKLQALAVDALSQDDVRTKLSLAYAIPKRYEYRNYSQGASETVLATLGGQAKMPKTDIDPIPAGGAVVTDEDVNSLLDELGI